MLRAARRWLAAQPGGSTRSRIVYFGESLGAAVVVGLAMERPPAALVLGCPLASRSGSRPCALPVAAGGSAADQPLSSIDRIGAVTAPLLVITAIATTSCPSLSRTLHTPNPKRYLSVPRQPQQPS